MAQPFVKSLGGKRKLVPELLKHIEPDFEAYIEPMVGGGALFWALEERGHIDDRVAWLTDVNADLIQAYKDVRNDPVSLAVELKALEMGYLADPETHYYAQRNLWNAGERGTARFIYLKSTSFNGLWRENKSGGMNAPWGKYKTPPICRPQLLNQCSKALTNTVIECRSFEEVAPDPGSLIYLDPPYVGTFTDYNAGGFTQEDQEELLKWAVRAMDEGSTVIYSQADTPEVAEMITDLWPDAHVFDVEAGRSVSRDGKGRKPAKEIIAVGRPHG